MKVRYSPLAQQFAAPDAIFAALRDLVASGDFTLGRPVREFEDAFAELIGTRFAIGVGTGTDALKLSLKALGVGAGDEVITNANTFVATVGAICEAGARPVFVDCDDSFCLDAGLLEAAITPATRAIMPAHLTGDMADMPRLTEIGARRGVAVVEDACQAMLSAFDGRPAGTWGRVAGFSMHPLKLINVWGDGGIVVTDEAELADTVRLLRNHGLRSRDDMAMLGYNTRLDSVQAVVGTWMLPQAAAIARIRAERAAYYDRGFRGLDGIRVPVRNPKVAHTYLLYIVFADERDALLAHCLENGIEAKVHYPIPLYRQQGLKHLGYTAGDFPVTDRHAREMITFPVDQHLHSAEQDAVIETVRAFYAGR